MDITVKDVPEKVYRVIKKEAEWQGRTLNSQILSTLADKAAEAERMGRLKSMRKELDRVAALGPKLSDSAPLIRAERDRR